MKKFKKLFKNKSKDDRNDLVVTKDHSIDADELANYIRNLEAENRDLKDTTTENNTISYKLGKTIIDTLNNQSSTTELPSKLLKIYAESRKRKLPSLKSASLVDKAIILLSDKELLNNYRLSDAKPEKKLEHKKNSRIDRVIKPENETNTIYEQKNIENPVFKKNIPTSNSVVNRKNYIDTDNKDAPFGSFSHLDATELSQNAPVWYEVPVQAGQVLTIKAASNYLNTKTTDRKAILLLKSYDSNGNEIHEPCGKLSYSSHLKGYFKYLHSTNNKVQDLHTFTVPDDVSKIHIGLCPFNITKGEQVFVSNFSIEPKINKSQIEKKLSFGSFKQQDTIELPQEDPVWYEVPVQVGQVLTIKAASEYLNTQATDRKAILLIKSYDSNGNEIHESCGKMSYSSHLNAYFKYLPFTHNKVQELHTFIVPSGVSQINIGLSGFNKNENEQVFVSNFSIEPKLNESQITKFVSPSAQAAEISIIGWPEYPINDKPYIIGIMDEFTTGSFEQDVNLIQPRPDNWFALAEKYKPVLFFIESAWKGNYGSWQYRVGQYANKPGHEIEQICQYARDKGIPTLFWNKEDPVHHEKFMCSAKLVDHIYTTDANMENSYITKTGNTNVHALPFAAQPALHKPASLMGRKPRSCFAGSWYGNRHAERGEAMGWLLQAANNYGLDIYDRNYGTGIFPFPEEYRAGIKGSLPYKELCEEYNRYRVFLNVNSVTESPTMFSRRVFELMACGTPVVSTYAKGIETLFDSDAVWLVNSQEEADEAIYTLMTDDAEWRRRSLAGIREIFSKHTYAHRLNSIFTDLNIESRIATSPNVMLFAKANNPAEIDVLEQFAQKQSYKEFLLVIEYAHSVASVQSNLSENIIFLDSEERKTWAIKNQNDYSIAGWVTPTNYYGEHYLRDLINASIYEPNAKGWAKALNNDVFGYGEQGLLSGALWEINEFFRRHVDATADVRIIDPNLYLADSDQFKNIDLEHQQVRGA
ncbi:MULTISPECIES: glycosyltransferase [unclassified Psychrobacter]|uniref:CgeB family protein n=1 Tax=unclassified Psychrobacter TaxID=196806 RepID=UPI0003F777D1|nr:MULTISPECIES: glycosyltransferase [unclassified Psychrobacter]